MSAYRQRFDREQPHSRPSTVKVCLTLTEETPFPLLMHTPAVTEPVAPHHRRMAMTTSGTKVPSPPDEWLPPVVRREATAFHSRPSTGHICPPLTEESSFPSYAHPCCDRARSASSLSIGDRYERSPSAQPTWRVGTAGGSTGVDRTAAPAALVTSAPLSSSRNHDAEFGFRGVGPDVSCAGAALRCHPVGTPAEPTPQVS